MYNLKIGVIESFGTVLEQGTKRLDRVGVSEFQLSCWDASICTPENAVKLKNILGNRVTISGVWAGWNVGPAAWNFTEGPLTIGLVPEEFRAKRIEGYKKIADFCKIIGVDNMTTHVGFMPEVPSSQEYKDLLAAIADVTKYCAPLGIKFCFETGEETPIAVLRCIEDLRDIYGLTNIGINLDPANLLMYGKGNPMDAMDIFGKYIIGVHVKDGKYPTNGKDLGHETKVGKGLVNFEVIIDKLHKLGYNGPLTIEREIEGEGQVSDIIETIDFLNNILNKYAK